MLLRLSSFILGSDASVCSLIYAILLADSGYFSTYLEVIRLISTLFMLSLYNCNIDSIRPNSFHISLKV